jgi:hypothetical protein
MLIARNPHEARVVKKKAKQKKKPTTPPVSREGVAPKPRPASSSPVGPAAAGNDWWRESGE